jgi:acyl carrier protein
MTKESPQESDRLSYKNSMTTRMAVLDALNSSCGLMERPEFASVIHSGGDIPLSELDLDSLSTYEVIMAIEEALGIDIKPDVVFSATTVSDLVARIECLPGNQ